VLGQGVADDGPGFVSLDLLDPAAPVSSPVASPSTPVSTPTPSVAPSPSASPSATPTPTPPPKPARRMDLRVLIVSCTGDVKEEPQLAVAREGLFKHSIPFDEFTTKQNGM